jgi:SAM-dependent methyltransferase
VLGYAERMQFADECFDKVVSFDSLHHWQDQARGLEEVCRVLKPEGRFFVVEVDPQTFGGWHVQTMETLLRMRSRFHPPDRLVEMLRRAGLRGVTQASVGQGFTYGVVATR